jgi:hypothetical protein
VLVLVLSAAVLVIVIDPAHPFSAIDSATPSIGDQRQVINGRSIASSSMLVSITSTSTVATRLSTSTTRDRQNGSDPQNRQGPKSTGAEIDRGRNRQGPKSTGAEIDRHQLTGTEHFMKYVFL